MKDEAIRANALFSTPPVFQLAIIYVIWRKSDTVTASVNGMFNFNHWCGEKCFQPQQLLYHPTLVGNLGKP